MSAWCALTTHWISLFLCTHFDVLVLVLLHERGALLVAPLLVRGLGRGVLARRRVEVPLRVERAAEPSDDRLPHDEPRYL